MCENHEKITRQNIKGQKIIKSASPIPIVYQSWSTSDFRSVTHVIDKKYKSQALFTPSSLSFGHRLRQTPVMSTLFVLAENTICHII